MKDWGDGAELWETEKREMKQTQTNVWLDRKDGLYFH